MSIWEYANPVKFIRTTDVVLPWISVAAVLCLATGLVWGFFFTPDDYRQGSTVKIFYLHVPAAMMAINAWAMMLVASLVWIVRRHHVSALAARAAARAASAETWWRRMIQTSEATSIISQALMAISAEGTCR